MPDAVLFGAKKLPLLSFMLLTCGIQPAKKRIALGCSAAAAKAPDWASIEMAIRKSAENAMAHTSPPFANARGLGGRPGKKPNRARETAGRAACAGEKAAGSPARAEKPRGWGGPQNPLLGSLTLNGQIREKKKPLDLRGVLLCSFRLPFSPKAESRAAAREAKCFHFLFGFCPKYYIQILAA